MMTQFNLVNSPEGPDPKRLLLAVVITSAVLMVYSYFFAPQSSTPSTAKIEKKDEIFQEQPVKANDLSKDEYKKHEQATASQIEIIKKVFEVIEKPDQAPRTSYRAVVSNHGGMIDGYTLLDYSKKQILFDEKLNLSSLSKLSSATSMISLSGNEPYEILGDDKDEIKLRHVTKEGLEIRRRYQFLDKATILEEISWRNLAKDPLKIELVLTSTKVDQKTKEPGFLNPGVDGQSIAVKTYEKYQKIPYADVIDKKKTFTNIKYLAFDDHFFLTAIIPLYDEAIEQAEILVQESGEDKKIARIDLKLKPFVLISGEKKSISQRYFIGPKQVNLLASLKTPLDENVDFGWFGVLSRPMLWLLVKINDFVKNYGLAIIIITFIIKLLTYPLTQKSFSSQQEMKKLQPKIKELQKKFGHDRTLLGQKQMELYKTHGVNPVAGCLPLLIQLPIWFAFFQMLRNSVELFDQPFYWWLSDLTRPDQYFVLPVLMGISMFIQQAFTPPPTDQPHMKYVMWGMPIFLTFIMLNMPSGLSLYILTNNLLTIIQQIIIKKNVEKINA
jgi:YidC/Oxa1 family membrane protein insertase